MARYPGDTPVSVSHFDIKNAKRSCPKRWCRSAIVGSPVLSGCETGVREQRQCSGEAVEFQGIAKASGESGDELGAGIFATHLSLVSPKGLDDKRRRRRQVRRDRRLLGGYRPSYDRSLISTKRGSGPCLEASDVGRAFHTAIVLKDSAGARGNAATPRALPHRGRSTRALARGPLVFYV